MINIHVVIFIKLLKLNTQKKQLIKSFFSIKNLKIIRFRMKESNLYIYIQRWG